MTEATTKVEFWIMALTVILIMTFGLYLFGNDMDNSNEVALDSDSSTYLSSYTSKLNTTGMLSKGLTSSTEDDAKNPFQKALSSIRDFFDVFGIFTLLTNVLVGLWTFLSIMFNIPSFFIETLGLNVGDWKFMINILSSVLILLATIIFVRLKK